MENIFWRQLNKHTGRLLSQIDRDPDSPTYGCFDRNFWNYKIRDFASIIQQQGILVLNVLYKYESIENIYYGNKTILNLILAGIDFWSESQLKTGAFNEYYPHESGFPPTAFSLYAVALILKEHPQFQNDEHTKAINKAVKWLLNNPEKEASNQESAALAGIVVAKDLEGIVYDSKKLDKRLNQFYESQHSEGWYNEYGGPDLGYLSVTIDSLWDIYRVSNDKRALEAARKAAAFIRQFITVSGDFPVMINSRNTDYIVPYGLLGFGSIDPIALSVAQLVIEKMKLSGSMFHKTDDRYLTHYIGQSYFRSLLLSRKTLSGSDVPAYFPEKTSIYLKGCKIFISHNNKSSIICSLNKGGILCIYEPSGIIASDYGWRKKTGKKIAVSHWQNESYNCFCKIDDEKTILTIEGRFSIHGYLRPSTIKHMVLRLMSFIAGNRIIGRLKSILIFNQKEINLSFIRKVSIDAKQVKIEDGFSPISEKNDLFRAPHYSLRHVSSAGRFVEEELIEQSGNMAMNNDKTGFRNFIKLISLE